VRAGPGESDPAGLTRQGDWKQAEDHVSESTEQHWDERYRERARIWSGRVNAAVADAAAPLRPGTALDLGCGEGGDALWLAERGWRVRAVDVSAVALERLLAQAEAAGLADQIDPEQRDLALGFPEGRFDLVSAAFLHSKIEFDREAVLRSAVAAVADGGLLLVVGHAEVPPWAHQHHAHEHGDGHGELEQLPGPEQVLADLALPATGWTVERCEVVEREGTGPDGEVAVLRDAVLAVRRVSS
jgi:SAM-dependent methyltransferase